MVTGKEMLFENVDEALKYVLKEEKRQLSEDPHRIKAPQVKIPYYGLEPIPVNSIKYPLAAWFNDASDDKFVMTRLQSGRYSLKPNLRNRKFLFRGEKEFHNLCKPNLFRDITQNRYTAELVMGQEMRLLLMSHPLVELLDTGVELCGEICRFEMNLFGLTQHYYNKTSFLDLTSNPQVAAFFATTDYDSKKDIYKPITDENHAPGVIYYYGLDINKDFVRIPGLFKSPLSTIGLQVFPRSGMQKGFLYDLRSNENFNDVVRVNAVRFKHKADIAERISSQFNYGKDLFPDDILMKHWRRENHCMHVISNRTVLMNKHDNPRMSIEEVEKEIRDLNFEIRDYKPAFTTEELDEYYHSVRNEGVWSKFCDQIFIPGDNKGKMLNALKKLPEDPRYRWAFERDEKHVPNYNNGFLLKEYRECLV